MLENTDFNLDGVDSYDMGVVNVHVDSSLISESFMPSYDIKEEHIRGREEPYLMDVTRSTLDIPLTIYFENSFTKSDLRKIAKWLKGDTDMYRPFYFIGDNTDRMFFVMLSGEPKITHNGHRGYIELTFKTSSSHGFSKEVSISEHVIYGEELIYVDNYGDEPVDLEVEIESLSNGDFSFINKTNRKHSFSLSGLKKNEVIYIDSRLKDIVSSEEKDEIYRYDDFNGDFPEVVTGKNEIVVTGNCKIRIKYRAILLQG